MRCFQVMHDPLRSTVPGATVFLEWHDPNKVRCLLCCLLCAACCVCAMLCVVFGCCCVLPYMCVLECVLIQFNSSLLLSFSPSPSSASFQRQRSKKPRAVDMAKVHSLSRGWKTQSFWRQQNKRGTLLNNLLTTY